MMNNKNEVREALTEVQARLAAAVSSLTDLGRSYERDGNVDAANRVFAKTEGVNLALSYVNEAIRDVDLYDYPPPPARRVRHVYVSGGVARVDEDTPEAL